MADKDLKIAVEIEAKKPDPVKVPVVADNVKIDTPKVAPVKVPVVADNVKIDTPKVAPVKVPVVSDKVTVDATKVPPIKVPVVADKVKIPATKVPTINVPVAIQGLNAARAALAKFASAFGVIGIGVSAVMALVSAFKWLDDQLKKTQRELARMRWADEMDAAARATKSLLSYHERLARIMKDENDTLSKQRELRDMQQNQQDDAEDGKRAADRARQIFEAATPEEEQRLRDKFAAEDEKIAADRKKRDTKAKINDLDQEESVYSSKARGLREKNAEIDAQLPDEKMRLRRATTDEDKNTIKERIKALEERKRANELEIAQFEKEAKFRRDKIAILEAGLETSGGKTAGEWQRATEQKKRQQEAEEKAWEEKKRKAMESDEARREFVESYERDQEAERDAKLSDLESAATRANSVDTVSQNRLTALGLGSGVKATGGVQTEMRRIIDLLKQNVNATKNIKPVEIDTTATFS